MTRVPDSAIATLPFCIISCSLTYYERLHYVKGAAFPRQDLLLRHSDLCKPGYLGSDNPVNFKMSPKHP